MATGEDRRLKGDGKTQSGIEVKEVYGPEDVAGLDYQEEIGAPGTYPFTRGSYPRMYRERLWVDAQPALGGSTPYVSEKGIDRERHFDRLMTAGVSTGGTRTGGDMHNLATVDPDHPLVRYDAGACGSISYSLWQMLEGNETILPKLVKKSLDEGFVIEFGHQVGTADVCDFTRYLALMEVQGWDTRKFRGNMVNDPLTSHITGSMNYKQPLEVGFRVSCDAQEYAYRNLPLYRPTNGGCAYDLRESGIDTFQELAFRFGNFIEYADEMVRRGLKFEDFGGRPAMAFSAEIDFFETICKLRAARRMWARIGAERYGAEVAKMKCPPVSTNSAGNSMTYQQQIFNVVRQTIETMASVLGGVNGMELKGYTEAVSPPTTEAFVVNAGIQRIIAAESNVCLTADPLGGSYYVEWLTDHIEKKSMELLGQILDKGGIRACVRSGWLQGEVERAAQERARELEEKRKIRVGVNMYQELADYDIPLPQFNFTRGKPGAPYTKRQLKALEVWNTFKRSRDLEKVKPALKRLYHAARDGENLVRPMVEAWKAYASIGEIMGVIREGMGFSYDQFEMVSRPEWLAY